MQYIFNLTEQERNALMNSVLRARNSVYGELNAMWQDYNNGGILNAQRYADGIKAAKVIESLADKITTAIRAAEQKFKAIIESEKDHDLYFGEAFDEEQIRIKAALGLPLTNRERAIYLLFIATAEEAKKFIIENWKATHY